MGIDELVGWRVDLDVDLYPLHYSPGNSAWHMARKEEVWKMEGVREGLD